MAAVILFALGGCLFGRHDELHLPEVTLFELFKSSGAEFVSSEVIFQGKLDTKYQNEDDLNKLVEGLTESLEITENCENECESVKESDFVKVMEKSGKTSEDEMVNIIIELKKPFELKNAGGVFEEGVIGLSISGSSTCDRVQEIRRNIEAVFACYKIKPEVKCTVTGFFDGKLDSKEMNKVCRNMLGALDARKVRDINGKNLVGVSAYSPAIGSFIEIDGDRSNIQLNFRYSAYEDKTFIWIGIPAIF